MAKCRLRTYDVGPPGNYSYVQTEGIQREFPSLPTIESQAEAVSSFRAANVLPRANLRQCIEDIDHYTAARLGCHRQWTVPIDSVAESTAINLPESHPMITKCAGCGAQLLTVQT